MPRHYHVFSTQTQGRARETLHTRSARFAPVSAGPERGSFRGVASEDRGSGEFGEDLGDFVEDLFDDAEKVQRIFRRAFPGTDQPDEEELRARTRKFRRAEHDKVLERAHRDGELDERETAAAARQEAAKGKHTLYLVTARHNRIKPFASDFSGMTQAVRVTIPKTRAEAEPIWTYLGVVKAEDHLMFSVEEVIAGYKAKFGRTPKVSRVDLLTGARHYDLDRFSPLSVYLAFAEQDDVHPIFYAYESGSAQGSPAVLYWAERMDALIRAPGGFRFTPFSCPEDMYTGKLVMNRANTEPKILSVSISQTKDDRRHYITLTTSYRIVEPGKVVWPVALQIQAAMRVFAIAQGMGCKLEVWEWGLGQVGRNAYDWITEPPQRGRGEGYSGCSQPSAPRALDRGSS